MQRFKDSHIEFFVTEWDLVGSLNYRNGTKTVFIPKKETTFIMAITSVIQGMRAEKEGHDRDRQRRKERTETDNYDRRERDRQLTTEETETDTDGGRDRDRLL